MDIYQINFSLLKTVDRLPRPQRRKQTKYQPGFLFKDLESVKHILPKLELPEIANLLKINQDQLILMNFNIEKIGATYYLKYKDKKVGFFTISKRHVYEL
jgi:hypothetical protein